MYEIESRRKCKRLDDMIRYGKYIVQDPQSPVHSKADIIIRASSPVGKHRPFGPPKTVLKAQVQRSTLLRILGSDLMQDVVGLRGQSMRKEKDAA
jgi:hypothetical protein